MTGLEGTAVMVEAAVSRQLPGMAIIGLPDTALAEAKLRVRTASAQSGLPLSDHFITVNLQPADLPKQGSGFDLAIALAALAASGRLPGTRLGETAHIGELGLDGELRRPAGLLAATVSARELGFRRVIVPEQGATEAALVPGVEIVAARDLAGAVAWHAGAAGAWRVVPPTPRQERRAAEEADMSDVIGQPEAVEALVIAASGGHHLSLLGPPGAGKTMLASRLPSILPDLTQAESLTASSIAALGGVPLGSLVDRPPFEAPHHTASAVSIIGGGDGAGVHAGAITRACHGVLFLDEAPEFPRSVLDGLRQPLESGWIEIHRARLRTTLPARIQLVLAANPCPCGNAGSPDTAAECRCSPATRVRYLQRISGPLNDRIDLHLTVRRVSSALLGDAAAPTPSSAELRERVGRARLRATERLRGTAWRVNSELPGTWLRSAAGRLTRADTAVLDRALARGALTLRGYHRVLRLAWTIADLAELERPGREEIARALVLRGGGAP
nr:YifB family Mg chelatase-like AAA ATPase [Leucobacter ruminantium]